MKYEKDYPAYKRLFWDCVLLGGYYWFKVQHAIARAIKNVVSSLRPKDPTVVSYAEFMRKRT